MAKREERNFLYPEEVEFFYDVYPKIYNETASPTEVEKYFKISDVIYNITDEYNNLMKKEDKSTKEIILIRKAGAFLAAMYLYKAKFLPTEELKAKIGMLYRNEIPAVKIRITAFKKVVERRKNKDIEIDTKDLMTDDEINMLYELDKKFKSGLLITENERRYFGHLLNKEEDYNNTYVEIMEKEYKTDVEKDLIVAFEKIFTKIDSLKAQELPDDRIDEIVGRLSLIHTPRGELWKNALIREKQLRAKGDFER